MLSWFSCIILDCAELPLGTSYLSLSKKKTYGVRHLWILRVLPMAPSVSILNGFDRITRSVRSVISNSRRNINYTDSNLFSDLTHRSIESWRQVRSLDILPLRWTILQLNWILANQYCKQLGTDKPAKTSVSSRSSPPGTFRAKRPSGEERGETNVFAG